MTWQAYLCLYAIIFCTGMSVGLNLRGNPPKRTRKTRKLKTLSNEAIGETNE